MIDNHDDSDEIDLPVLPAFARLHPNDHPLAVDRGRLQGNPARLQRPSIQRLRVGVAALTVIDQSRHYHHDCLSSAALLFLGANIYAEAGGRGVPIHDQAAQGTLALCH